MHFVEDRTKPLVLSLERNSYLFRKSATQILGYYVRIYQLSQLLLRRKRFPVIGVRTAFDGNPFCA